MEAPKRTIVLCIFVSIVVQLCLPHVVLLIQRLSCRYMGVCDRRPQSAVALSRYTSLPSMESTHQTGTYELSNVVVKRHEAEPTSPALEKEALAAVSAAKSYRNNGNLKRAKVVIEHAVSLLPQNPDVLTEYGTIFEHMDNILEADLCYTKALAFDPIHQGALERRRYTQPLVYAADQKMFDEIEKKKEEFNRLAHSSSMRRAMRESYFMHVYHTVAIEGNTLTLGETRSILETGFAVHGKSVLEHNEVLGMDSALRFLNHSLLHQNEITLQDILDIHHRVLGNVNPIDAGKIRSTQVYVGRFTPVAPEFVQEQMEELVEWLNSEESAEMSPVEKAAIAHYKLVVVHPFVDGNGRTARLLLNLILMKAGYPPVILPVESRAEYYAVLNTANMGDLRPFVRYVATHTENNLKQYICASTTPHQGDHCGISSEDHRINVEPT